MSIDKVGEETLLSDCTVFILRFILFAGVHSLFATFRVKRALHGTKAREPRSYRLIYNLSSLIIFGWVMGACRNSPVLYYVPGVWSLVMYLLQLLIAAMLFGCLRQTGISDFLGFSQLRTGITMEPRLVTTGCYAMVRHPLYLFAILFLILNPVMTLQWLMLTILSSIYFVGGALIEERRLVKLFGDDYRRYQREVPFIIPNPGRLRQPPSA